MNKIDSMYNKSSQGDRKRVVRKNKNIKKDNYKKLAKGMLVVAATLVILVPPLKGKIDTNNKLKDSN